MDQLTYEQFVTFLRSALHYLFDPVQLRRSPLVGLLGLSDQFDQAAALQQTLIVAIREMKPDDNESPQSRAWRIYDTLNLQYVRQLQRDAVATQLGMSERQMRREQRMAIEALAQQIWQQKIAPSSAAIRNASVEDSPPPDDQTLSKELSWLTIPAAEGNVPLSEAIEDVLALARPLARQWQVTLVDDLPNELYQLAVSELALRSILLTLLSVAIPRAEHASIGVNVLRQGDTIRLSIRCSKQTGSQRSFSAKEADAIEMAHELAAFHHAQLEIAPADESAFSATLSLPTPTQVTVLVIDDNTDWLELVQRYSSGSRYQIFGTRDSGSAPALVAKMQPALVLLDVMMQHVDGWQVLSELRQDPATSHVPVIVCTVLPVEEMAIALGASAFMQKPISQQTFLQILDRQDQLP